MKKLVLIAASGTDFVSALKKSWDDGHCIAPLDMRLSASQQKKQALLIQPDLVIEGSSNKYKEYSCDRTYAGLSSDDALVIPTSGSSGEPKLVIHTHKSLQASSYATSKALGVAGSDIWLACLPFAHIGGLSVIIRAIHTGTDFVVHDSFSAESVTKEAQNGATLVSLVTRMLNQIDPALFRKILVGGGPAPKNVPNNVIPTYGMTETGSGVVYGRKVVEGAEFKTVERQLFVKGPMLFRKYRGSDIEPFVDGWFPTGDLGSVNTDGSIEVFGRMSEAIRTGGEDVWPQKLEEVLVQHPLVKDVAIRSIPDPEWGERVITIIIPEELDNPPVLEDLKELSNTHLPAWYAPKEIRIVKEIPRTALGKIQRSKLVN